MGYRKMTCRKFVIFVLFSLFLSNICFAVIPVYCPKCREYLYNYQKDTIDLKLDVKAEDFKPAFEFIPQPVENTPMTCPLCNAELNGWDYYGEYNQVKSHTNPSGAISILTKVDNKFKWVPWHVPDTGIEE